MTQNEAGASGEWCTHLKMTLDAMTESYNRLEALSQKQQSLMHAGEVEPMLALLAKREPHVTSLEALSQRFMDGIDAWSKFSQTLTEPTRLMLERRLSAIEQAASTIADRDEAVSQWLESARSEIARELSGLSRQTAATNAYGQSMPGTPKPMFQDREG